jgi:hypothetical protein
MNRFLTYVTSLGFQGVSEILSSKNRQQIRAFSYEQFNPKQVQYTIGRPKAHAENLLVWKITRDKALRVDSTRQRILLCNGRKAVQALLRTVNK